MRKPKSEVRIGGVMIGGDHSIKIQSMTNTATEDVDATVSQIHRLEDAGCHIIRVAVPTPEAARAIEEIKKRISIPIIADIHFNFRLAVIAAEYGADKIRINPGNIGSEKKVEAVVQACRAADIPIRVGVNSGSVNRMLLLKEGMERALVISAQQQIESLERMNFNNMVVAIKSSDVFESIRAYEKIDELYDYPLHIGITEAGTAYGGIIKSSAGLGILLYKGIGSTLRISLTADPVEEVKAAKTLLNQLGISRTGPKIIACPTCGRTKVDLINLAGRVEEALAGCKKNITVAVMGCEVNGPGEAAGADIGLAGGSGKYAIFKKGKVIKRMPESEVLEELLRLIEEHDEEDTEPGKGQISKEDQ